MVSSDGEDDKISHILLQELFDLVILFSSEYPTTPNSLTLGYSSVKCKMIPLPAPM